MNGRRLPDTPLEKLPDDVQAGDYWKITDFENIQHSTNLTGKAWRVAAPMSYGYAIGTLTKHTVRENDDGTISVKPGDGSSNSILITGHHGEQFHGYIYEGRWEKA
jgi:hypothetical protein